jgi:hypothetical protein
MYLGLIFSENFSSQLFKYTGMIKKHVCNPVIVEGALASNFGSHINVSTHTCEEPVPFHGLYTFLILALIVTLLHLKAMDTANCYNKKCQWMEMKARDLANEIEIHRKKSDFAAQESKAWQEKYQICKAERNSWRRTCEDMQAELELIKKQLKSELEATKQELAKLKRKMKAEQDSVGSTMWACFSDPFLATE